MTNQIFVISVSSLEGGNGNIEPEKSVVWSRFHQDYQHQHNTNHNLNTGQTDEGSESETEDQDIKSQSEDNEDKEDHEDFFDDDEDIFTKSLAPEHLDLKNFLTVKS